MDTRPLVPPVALPLICLARIMAGQRLVFNRAAMWPGDIIERASDTVIGRGIRLALQAEYNHDALWIQELNDGRSCYIGDAELPRARLTPIAEYERDMAAGKCRVRVVRPAGATLAQGQAASDWWVSNVKGSPYDLQAYWRLVSELGLPFRLAAKLAWDRLYPDKPFPDQCEWEFFCTEGVAGAWRDGAHFSPDPWRGKKLPTPRTTEKRTHEGIFRVVQDALIAG